jgi:hypothetical protein
VAVLVLASFVVACTTTRTIDVGAPSALAEEVHPGDRVAITTHDGQELTFEIVRVERDALVGATERVQRDKIARLEVTRLSPARTAGLAGGGMLLVVMIAGLVFVAVAPAMIFRRDAITSWSKLREPLSFAPRFGSNRQPRTG